jgi:hypothetical protein
MEFDLGDGITLRISDRQLAQQLLDNTDRLDRLLASLRKLSGDPTTPTSTDTESGQRDSPNPPATDETDDP